MSSLISGFVLRYLRTASQGGGLLSWLGFTEATVRQELGISFNVAHTAVDFILGGIIRMLQSPRMSTTQVDKGLSVLFVFIHGACPTVICLMRIGRTGFGWEMSSRLRFATPAHPFSTSVARYTEGYTYALKA